MSINGCCENSMHQIDRGGEAASFLKTGERNPIGKQMLFYTCLVCDLKWCRTEQTCHPFEVRWAYVS